MALPTLGALLAPPLFVLTDTAMVGHLGTPQLAGLAVASTLLTTVVGLLVFLAYATTANVAQRVGAGDRLGALRAGVDGLWFAGGIGVLAAGALVVFGRPIVAAMGAGGEIADQAMSYLFAAATAVVGMLLNYAATGALRGFSRVRLVLAVSVVGALANIGLNALFIYGLGLGVAGSGLGTTVAESLMALVLILGLRREAADVGMLPTWSGIKHVGLAGWPLFLRTLSLRASLLATVWVATALGEAALSGHQIVISWWYFMAYALDAVAIAAQTLIGEAVGAKNPVRARELLGRCVRWGIGTGVILGVALAGMSPWLPTWFTGDPEVWAATTPALLVAAAALPVAGLVYILDGVLIGAGDGRYLAWTGLVNLLTYLPFLWLVTSWAPPGGLVWLWVAYCVTYMGSRAVTLSLRASGDAWLR